MKVAELREILNALDGDVDVFLSRSNDVEVSAFGSHTAVPCGEVMWFDPRNEEEGYNDALLLCADYEPRVVLADTAHFCPITLAMVRS